VSNSEPNVILAVFIAIIILLVLVPAALYGAKGAKLGTRRLNRDLYGEQLEIDLRLTYKRFKELYPFSTMTYEEYKKLQKERAFKRALSSQKNKRMVR